MSDTGNTSDAPAAAPEDLDQRVQALVDEIDQTTARIEQVVADDADEAEGADQPEGEAEAGSEAGITAASEPAPEAVEPTAAATPEPAATEPEHAPDPEAPGEPVAAADPPPAPEATWAPADEPPEAPPPSAPAQQPAGSGPPQSLDSLDADLEADLDRLLAAEACAESGPEAARQEETAAPDPELEQELDELLREGEITAPDVEAAASESGSSKLDQQLAGLRDDDLKGGPEPRHVEPDEDEQVGSANSASSASPPRPAASPAPAQPVVEGLEKPKAAEPAPGRSLVKAGMIELADFVRRGGPQVARRVEPVAYQAAAALNKPLEERTRAKQIVGWLALYTAFLAACVWVYVLFLRPAGPPERGEERGRMVGVE